MGPISRLMRTVRNGFGGRQTGAQSYYNGLVQRQHDGAPHYNETRRDYEVVRRISHRSRLF